MWFRIVQLLCGFSGSKGTPFLAERFMLGVGGLKEAAGVCF